MMNAKQKIAQIITDVVIYELSHSDDGQLLSEETDRWIEARPVGGRLAILVPGIILLLHLSNSVPDRFDIFSKKFWKKIFN